jgi:hypothetical protein
VQQRHWSAFEEFAQVDRGKDDRTAQAVILLRGHATRSASV